MIEYKDPTVRQKIEIRKEFEKISDFQNLKIIPTDLAMKICEYCFEVGAEEFFSLGEVKIAELALEGMNKLFFESALDKKK